MSASDCDVVVTSSCAPLILRVIGVIASAVTCYANDGDCASCYVVAKVSCVENGPWIEIVWSATEIGAGVGNESVGDVNASVCVIWNDDYGHGSASVTFGLASHFCCACP